MRPKLKPLDQQVIAITGASSGIGLVTARMAAQRGAKVMLIARDGDMLSRIAGELNADGHEAAFHAADVGDLFAVQAAADAAIARFGRIDTWVNNAGVAIYAKLLATPVDEHERLFRTNYFGTVNGCLAAASALREQGGAIVTIGSVVSELPSPVMGAYAASKHAVAAYVRALRMELAESGVPISVSLVKPSGVDTPIAQHAANHEGGEAQIPPPAYDPALVAEAILDCAEHPRREITVGGAGRLQVLGYAHFPRLTEWLSPKAARGFTDDRKMQPRPDGLFQSVRTGRERSGETSARQTSTYTATARHPAVTTLALAAAAIAGGAALMARRPSGGTRRIRTSGATRRISKRASSA